MLGEHFDGEGSGIKGGYFDVNQDTAALFTERNNPQMVIDDTIFFGILGAQTRSRNASKQGKLGGTSTYYTWQGAKRTFEAAGATPAPTHSSAPSRSRPSGRRRSTPSPAAARTAASSATAARSRTSSRWA